MEAAQRASELTSLKRQHTSLSSSHAAALKEMDALHAAHANAARRAEEALAELALVRESQQALTAQVRSALHCVTARAGALQHGVLLLSHILFRWRCWVAVPLLDFISVANGVNLSPARAPATALAGVCPA